MSADFPDVLEKHIVGSIQYNAGPCVTKQKKILPEGGCRNKQEYSVMRLQLDSCCEVTRVHDSKMQRSELSIITIYNYRTIHLISVQVDFAI